jgi:hypothetical protein
MRRSLLLLLAILIVAGVVRVHAFGLIPPGLNQDEASAGYEAWALLHHGVDRNGYRYPVHLVSWGSGQNALYSYLAMPVIAVFGLNVRSLRAVSLIAGLLTLLVFHALARKAADEPTALLATFLLAVSPWHIMVSRWALESNLFPATFALGVWLLLAAVERPRLLPLALAGFAVSLYAYGPAYLVVPVFLCVSAAYLAWQRRLHQRAWVLGALAFLLVALPIGTFVAVNLLELEPIRTPLISIPRLTATPRFTAVAGVGEGSGALDNFGRFLSLMARQNDPRIFNVVPGFGHGYAFGPALAAVGLVVTVAGCLRARGYQPRVLVLFWLLGGCLLGFLYPVPNTNRVNIVFLPLIFVTAVGVVTVARWLGGRWPGTAWGNLQFPHAPCWPRHLRVPGRPVNLHHIVIGGVVLVYLVSFAQFTRTYFTVFSRMAAPAFFPGLGPAIEVAEAAPGPICVTGSINAPYIFALFHTRTDPRAFRASARFSGPVWGIWQVESFGRYTFGLNNCRLTPETAVILRRDEVAGPFREGDVVQPFGPYLVVVPRPRG